MSKLPPLSALSKAQLIDELHEYEVDVNPRWTVPELRELVKGFRRDRQTEHDPLKGLSQKTKMELTELCQEANIRIPDKSTRGLMMLLLREHFETPVSGSTLVSFGEHKGKRYDEVPSKYLEWAAKEDSPSKQLRDLLQWHNRQTDANKEKNKKEAMTNKSMSASTAEPSSGYSAPAAPQRSGKRSSASSEASSWSQVPAPMDQSSLEAKLKIEDLEAQLAILKRQQGSGARGSTPSEQ